MSTNRKTRLKNIEKDMYNAGKSLVKNYEKDKDVTVIKSANQCYRTSMQAMRLNLIRKNNKINSQ